MSATILLKRSSTASAVPADLQAGELACNTADGKLFLGTGSTVLDVTAGSGMTNPMTTAGDIIYGGTNGAPTRLAKGTDGQVLTLASGNPSWAAASGGSLLVAETVVSGSAVTSVEFTGLDGNADGGYVVAATRMTGGTGNGLKMYFNGDTTDSNYNAQAIYLSSNTVLASNNFAAAWLDAAGGLTSSNPSQLEITIDINARIVCMCDSHVYTNGAVTHNINRTYLAHLVNQSNITSFSIQATAANDIGIGSRFRLYKRK